MEFDAKVMPSRLSFIIKIIFLTIVILLSTTIQLSWWQNTIIILTALLCLWLDYQRQHQLYFLATKDSDELWQLGINRHGRQEIWQGYLQHTKDISIAIQLTFHITTPIEMTHSVLIFKDSIDNHHYRYLVRLSKFHQSST